MSTQVDADTTIPDLVRRLTADSRRLARNEMRLAKLEMHENVRDAATGSIWLAVAFGVGIVAVVALTLLLISGVARITGHYWAGAVAVGVVELLVGWLVLRRGLRIVEHPIASQTEGQS